MLIDLAVLCLLILALFKGIRNGLVLAVFSFLAFLVGLAAAIKLSAVVAGYLKDHSNIGERWLPVLAFAVIFFVVTLLVRLGAKAIESGLKLAMLGWANRLGGFLFYALLYLFILSIVLFYAVQLKLFQPQTLASSVSFPYLRPLGPKLVNGVGYVLPFFKNMFAELEGFFEKISGRMQ
jgi:membrane protein required for colicin V production